MRVRLMSGAAFRQHVTQATRREIEAALRPPVERYLLEQRPNLVIVGDANGVDQWAREWCSDMGIDLLVGHALWRKLGKSAGMRRNDSMALVTHLVGIGADASQRDGDVRLGAAPGPTSVGTLGMVTTCQRLRVPIDAIGPWQNKVLETMVDA